MNNNDILEELILSDENELNIFLDTLKEIFEQENKKGSKQHER